MPITDLLYVAKEPDTPPEEEEKDWPSNGNCTGPPWEDGFDDPPDFGFLLIEKSKYQFEDSDAIQAGYESLRQEVNNTYISKMLTHIDGWANCFAHYNSAPLAHPTYIKHDLNYFVHVRKSSSTYSDGNYYREFYSNAFYSDYMMWDFDLGILVPQSDPQWWQTRWKWSIDKQSYYSENRYHLGTQTVPSDQDWSGWFLNTVTEGNKSTVKIPYETSDRVTVREAARICEEKGYDTLNDSSSIVWNIAEDPSLEEPKDGVIRISRVGLYVRKPKEVTSIQFEFKTYGNGEPIRRLAYSRGLPSQWGAMVHQSGYIVAEGIGTLVEVTASGYSELTSNEIGDFQKPTTQKKVYEEVKDTDRILIFTDDKDVVEGNYPIDAVEAGTIEVGGLTGSGPCSFKVIRSLDLDTYDGMDPGTSHTIDVDPNLLGSNLAEDDDKPLYLWLMVDADYHNFTVSSEKGFYYDIRILVDGEELQLKDRDDKTRLLIGNRTPCLGRTIVFENKED
jgi:hypothetical protein